MKNASFCFSESYCNANRNVMLGRYHLGFNHSFAFIFRLLSQFKPLFHISSFCSYFFTNFIKQKLIPHCHWLMETTQTECLITDNYAPFERKLSFSAERLLNKWETINCYHSTVSVYITHLQIHLHIGEIKRKIECVESNCWCGSW